MSRRRRFRRLGTENSESSPSLDTRRGVLVVDAGERSAFATCRALAEGGYRVGTGSSRRPAPADWSRFSEHRFRLPNPRSAPHEFAATVAHVAARHSYDTVLPCSEGSLWALSSSRNVFPQGFALGLPGRKVVTDCMSKVRLHELGPQAGLGVAETLVRADREEAIAAATELGLPVVLKPRSTVFEDGLEMKHLAARIVPDRESLERQLEGIGWPCLVQRRMAGKTVSCGGVAAADGLLALVCSRYERTWPEAGGSATFSHSIVPPASLVESVRRLVALFGWEGIFELELIEPEPCRFVAIDFNPRTYGSVALAVKAGVPLPAVWCDWLFEDRRVELQAPAGFSYRWLDGDLSIVGECLHRRDYRAAAAVLRPHRRVAHAYFRLDDPLPLVVRGLSGVAALRRGSRNLAD